MIRFPFNEQKTAQAAAHLLAFCGGQLPYLSLIKMLYLADRQALIDIGQPITGDRPVSMKNGPVLSQVMDIIHMGTGPLPSGPGLYWYRLISPPRDFEVKLTFQVLEDSELSDYEIGVLRQVAERFGSLDRWDLVNFTHTLPEWQDPQGSMIPIDPADILKAAGKPAEDIERVAAEAESQLFMSQLSAAFG